MKPYKIIYLVISLLLMIRITNAQEAYITERQFITELKEIDKPADFKSIGEDILLTRAQAASIVVQYLGYEGIADSLRTYEFTDVTENRQDIELVRQLGIMNGTGNGQFSPHAKITLTQAQHIVNQIKISLKKSIGWKHVCYAISSSSQMNQIPNFDAVSFGWAELIETDGKFQVVTSRTESDFKVPQGFTRPIDLAKNNQVETYLMVYFEDHDGKAENFLKDKEQTQRVINQLVELSKGLTKEGETRSFDGITIDFEGFKSEELQPIYVEFISALRKALKAEGKALNVTLQPSLYYKGYDYKGIAQNSDHVILMAHDYATKMAKTVKDTKTPLTPIAQVYTALQEAKSQIVDTNKIVLQFSMGSLQWQTQKDILLNSTAYTPTFDKIEARLNMPGVSKIFDGYTQCTYATYVENGINNTIWFEDDQSIQSKVDLAKLLGITNVSYWRLGILPSSIQLVY